MYVDYPLNEITLKVVTETHLRHATVLPGINDVFCLSASNLTTPTAFMSQNFTVRGLWRPQTS